VTINTLKVAEAAQLFMAYLEENHGEDELLEVGIVVELRRPSEDNEDGECHTPTFCTAKSRVYQTGLFQWALDGAEWTGEPGDEPEAPEE
jgi:hypothetical protein